MPYSSNNSSSSESQQKLPSYNFIAENVNKINIKRDVSESSPVTDMCVTDLANSQKLRDGDLAHYNKDEHLRKKNATKNFKNKHDTNDGNREKSDDDIDDSDFSKNRSESHTKNNNSEQRDYSRKEEHTNNDKKNNGQNSDDSGEITDDEIKRIMEKMDLLSKFAMLQNNGIKISTNYTMESDIRMMRTEYELHKKTRMKLSYVDMFENAISIGGSLAETVNNKYKPFGFEIQNFQSHITNDAPVYREAFGEIYDMYLQTNKPVNPFLKLLGHLIKTFLFSQASGWLEETTGMPSNLVSKFFGAFSKKTADAPQQRQNGNYMSHNEIVDDMLKKINERVKAQEYLNITKQKQMYKNEAMLTSTEGGYPQSGFNYQNQNQNQTYRSSQPVVQSSSNTMDIKRNNNNNMHKIISGPVIPKHKAPLTHVTVTQTIPVENNNNTIDKIKQSEQDNKKNNQKKKEQKKDKLSSDGQSDRETSIKSNNSDKSSKSITIHKNCEGIMKDAINKKNIPRNDEISISGSARNKSKNNNNDIIILHKKK